MHQNGTVCQLPPDEIRLLTVAEIVLQQRRIDFAFAEIAEARQRIKRAKELLKKAGG